MSNTLAVHTDKQKRRRSPELTREYGGAASGRDDLTTVEFRESGKTLTVRRGTYYVTADPSSVPPRRGGWTREDLSIDLKVDEPYWAPNDLTKPHTGGRWTHVRREETLASLSLHDVVKAWTEGKQVKLVLEITDPSVVDADTTPAAVGATADPNVVYLTTE